MICRSLVHAEIRFKNLKNKSRRRDQRMVGFGSNIYIKKLDTRLLFLPQFAVPLVTNKSRYFYLWPYSRGQKVPSSVHYCSLAAFKSLIIKCNMKFASSIP